MSADVLARAGSAGTEAPRRRPLGDIREFQADILAALRRGWQEQGDLARYRLGPVKVVGISSPELAEKVLTDSAGYSKLGRDNPLRLALGDGLLTNSDHPDWLRKRRMVQPAYHGRSMQHMFRSMQDCTVELADRWQRQIRAGDVLDLHVQMMHVTLDIVSRAMFSRPMLTGSALSPKAVDVAINYTFSRLQNPLAPPMWLPTPRNRRFRGVMAGLDELMFGLIRDRRSGTDRHSVGSVDLLDMLVDARDADTGAGMTDREVRDEVITTFAAGHETTAITLSWAYYLLSNHPEQRAQLHAEIDSVLGDRLPEMADLQRLPYTKGVFEEALRLYPSAPIVPRLVTRPTVLASHHLEPGTRVLIDLYNIHRHPDHWPNPERFDPTRFSPENSRGRARYAHMPFGGGPHLCVGKQFALLEAQVLLAVLSRRFEMRHVPTHPVVNHATITLRPKFGMQMTVHPRQVAP